MQTDRLVYFVYEKIDMKHLAEKIKELMAAFSRSHYEYMMFEEYGMPDFSKLSEEERLDYEMDEQERKDSLIYMAKKLRPLVQAYIEAKHLPDYYNSFLTEITPFYEKERMLRGTEDMDSELIFAYRKFLNAFDDFSITGAHKEFEILENILNSTAMLIRKITHKLFSLTLSAERLAPVPDGIRIKSTGHSSLDSPCIVLLISSSMVTGSTFFISGIRFCTPSQYSR